MAPKPSIEVEHYQSEPTPPVRTTATKAHYAAGVSGLITAVLTLGMYAAGAIELGQSDIMAAVAAIGAGLGSAAVVWLGTFASPSNKPK